MNSATPQAPTGADRKPKGKDEQLDAQKIINVLGAVVFAIFGWLGNNVWQSSQSQQAQITQLNIELAKNYMPRVELQDQLNRMSMKLDTIDQQTRKPKP